MRVFVESVSHATRNHRSLLILICLTLILPALIAVVFLRSLAGSQEIKNSSVQYESTNSLRTLDDNLNTPVPAEAQPTLNTKSTSTSVVVESEAKDGAISTELYVNGQEVPLENKSSSSTSSGISSLSHTNVITTSDTQSLNISEYTNSTDRSSSTSSFSSTNTFYTYD